MAEAQELIYLNVSSIAPGSDTPTQPEALYSEFRSQAILDGKASDYRLSVIRFQVTGQELPLWIPSIKTGQPDPKLTNYQLALTMVYSAGPVVSPTFQSVQSVYWSPQFQDEPVPEAPIVRQDMSTRYYWCLDFWHALAQFNVAIAAAQTAVATQFVAWWLASGQVGPAPAVPAAPTLSYEPATDRFTLHTDAGGAQGWSIAMNGPMRALFDHFPCVVSHSASPFKGPAYTTRLAAGNSATQQMCSSTDIWTPVLALAFITSALPIASEDMAPPYVLANNAALSSNRDFQNVLTDISIALEHGARSYMAAITYSPYVYRWTSLTSDQAIQSLSFQLMWRSRLDGLLRPVRLAPSGSMSMKALLQRKW
jgi:hypothetical protein